MGKRKGGERVSKRGKGRLRELSGEKDWLSEWIVSQSSPRLVKLSCGRQQKETGAVCSRFCYRHRSIIIGVESGGGGGEGRKGGKGWSL